MSVLDDPENPYEYEPVFAVGITPPIGFVAKSIKSSHPDPSDVRLQRYPVFVSADPAGSYDARFDVSITADYPVSTTKVSYLAYSRPPGWYDPDLDVRTPDDLQFALPGPES